MSGSGTEPAHEPSRRDSSAVALRVVLPLLGVLVLATLVARAGGLDPPSLWLDDAWVGFIVRHASLADLFTYSEVAPMGFCALLKPFALLAGDPELGLQLLPLLADLAAIGAIAWLVTGVTGRPALGLLAAVCLAVNPWHVTYAVRVKQYTLDSLVVIGLLAAGLGRLDDARPARLARMSAGSFVAAVLSFVSVFVALPLVHLPLLPAISRRLRGHRESLAGSMIVVAVFDAALAAFYFLRLRRQSRPFLDEYWIKGFAPTESIDAFAGFVWRSTRVLLDNALGFAPTKVAMLLVVLGFAWLLIERRRRLQALFFASFFSGMYVAAALRIYPVGAGRPDMFMFPVVLVLCAYGFAALLSPLAAWSRRVDDAGAVALAALAIVVFASQVHASRYMPVLDAQLIRFVDRVAGDDDAVLIHGDAQYTLGYYLDWPIEPDFDRGAEKFTLRPLRPRTQIARAEAPAFSDDFLADEPKRLIYVEVHVRPSHRELHRHIYDAIAAAGYVPTVVRSASRARAIVFERNDSATSASHPARAGASLRDGERFGSAVARIGDLDGDGVVDLAVGAEADGREGVVRGAVWLLFLTDEGTVRASRRIAPGLEPLLADVTPLSAFGASLAAVGDLDGDGLEELAVGAPFDDDGGFDRGAVWILFLQPDGRIRAVRKISALHGGFDGTLDDADRFGSALAALGDLDGDGVGDLAVGADKDDDGCGSAADRCDYGAIWILFLRPDGSVKAERKISVFAGGLDASLVAGDYFGSALAAIGDLDADGVSELAVGAHREDDGRVAGAVYVLYLERDGTVRKTARLDGERSYWENDIPTYAHFGAALADLGAEDDDGPWRVAIGAPRDDGNGLVRGTVRIVRMASDAGLLSSRVITARGSGFSGHVADFDYFGASLASLPGLQTKHGATLAVGAPGDDSSGAGGVISDTGAVWLLFLRQGAVVSWAKIDAFDVGLGAVDEGDRR